MAVEQHLPASRADTNGLRITVRVSLLPVLEGGIDNPLPATMWAQSQSAVPSSEREVAVHVVGMWIAGMRLSGLLHSAGGVTYRTARSRSPRARRLSTRGTTPAKEANLRPANRRVSQRHAEG